jgi:hypothetical protein
MTVKVALQKECYFCIVKDNQFAAANEEIARLKSKVVLLNNEHNGIVDRDILRINKITELEELLATERLSTDKTLDHNNRLINKVDELEAENKLLKDTLKMPLDQWVKSTRDEAIRNTAERCAEIASDNHLTAVDQIRKEFKL